MDRRNHPRAEISVHLRIEAPGLSVQGIARDISTRGIFVEFDVEFEQARASDNLHDVRLYFAIDTGAHVLSRQIDGKVVRNEGDGLAIRFAEHDILGRAVVHELMYYLQLSRGESLPDGGCTHDHTQWPEREYAA
ncbi:MAG: PilZ domain-containing protein [Gammaproteobacteria bacterium]|nr:PilZ domain-containing protein [Gammaproteobacteria bacterium]